MSRLIASESALRALVFVGLALGGIACDAHDQHAPVARVWDECQGPRSSGLPPADPALQIAAVDDTEYQDDAVLVDDVVHDPVLTHAKAVERVVHSLDRLD